MWDHLWSLGPVSFPGNKRTPFTIVLELRKSGAQLKPAVTAYRLLNSTPLPLNRRVRPDPLI